MPNKRYQKGYRFEIRVKKYLEKKGYKVFRLAGSKPIDLIAVKKNGESILYIECKTTKITKRSGEKLVKEIDGLPGRPILAYRDEKNRIRFIDPKDYIEVTIPPTKRLPI